MARNAGKKVFVGLSGGVDSAVSAALLVRQGYDVVGVFIRIALPGYPCTAGEDKIDAMRVAAALKIPFLELDLSSEYEQRVFRSSLQEFRRGFTPNPDTLCNREIKFGLFYEFARSQRAEYVATGHYAQIKNGLLYAGADEVKDQSYFLWMVKKEILERAIFPVGSLKKSEVRRLAREFDLPNAARRDSQGLCFLGDISIDDMLDKELAPAAGDVISEDGVVVGRHRGAAHYTLGQRHGFELSAHSPNTEPHFVIGKDIGANTITVSTQRYPKGTAKTLVTLKETNWIGGHPAQCFARFRYHQKLIPAVICSEEAAELQEAQYVPLGQSLVLYDGAGRCLGGGIVDKSELQAS